MKAARRLEMLMRRTINHATCSWVEHGSRAIAGLRPTPCQQRRRIRICAVGDTLLGHEAQADLDEHGYEFQFLRLRDVIRDHDLLVGNLEGPITGHGTPVSGQKECVFKQKLPAARALKDFGFDVLCLANNHILDYGPTGLADTQQALDDAGIGHFGAGCDLEASIQGHIVERAGVRIGLLAFMQYWSRYDREFKFYARNSAPGVAEMSAAVFRKAMFRMRPQVDVLIVSFHWGPEREDVRPEQRIWGRRAVHFGADLVIGHHPHVAQGVEVVCGVPVLYSLGNFAFAHESGFEKLASTWHYGWIADITFEASRCTQVDLTPIETNTRVVNYQPRIASREAIPGMLQTLNQQFATPMEVVGTRVRLRLA